MVEAVKAMAGQYVIRAIVLYLVRGARLSIYPVFGELPEEWGKICSRQQDHFSTVHSCGQAVKDDDEHYWKATQ